ncbi:flagellar hook-length control protein FliK [Cellvibrio mixtus]|uniref:flagellar hook-length control protein FliK n=1 Tax=Cellvibrio mixtus TaxID=39650 RepID=UPI0006937E6C|nr:flagellar hook-length control protein FliK [Cellvibrio mixtus]
MNSGNLLNSLLGATGANAAASKNASPKIRIDTSEQFRNALEQARPEVAAPKPAARKAPPTPAPRAEPRSVDAADSRAKTKADARPSADRQIERSVSTTGASKKSETNTCSKAGDSGKNPESKDVVRQESNDIEQAAVAQAKPTGEVDAAETEVPVIVNALLAAGELEVSPDVSTEDPGLALEDPSKKAVTPDDASINPALLPLDGTLVYPLVATPPENAPVLQVLSGSGKEDASDLPESDIDASILLAQSGASAVTTPSLKTVTTSSFNNVSGTNNGNANAPLTTPMINQMPIDTAASKPDEQAGLLGEPAPETSADNPDFLLLSGKAVLGKLMDTNVSADKTAATIDAAKPALTPTVLTEPLTRLAEPQSPAARNFVVQTGVPVAVGQPQWNQAVGEKVLWLAAQNVSAAEIRLDPPDLGQLHVKVSVNQDQATVTFTSPHPMVRDALDQQLNRLREMFSEQGLNLVNVDVSDKSFAQHEQERGQGGSAGTSGDVDDDELVPVAMTTITSTRLVDHYA